MIRKRRVRRRRQSRRQMLLLATAVVSLVLVLFLANKGCASVNCQDDTEDSKSLWSDTLTNAASDLDVLRPMDREIERFMARNGIKGMSVAMMSRDSLQFAKGYGWADEQAHVPMAPSTMMRIASASKLITAIAVMKLVEEGKLNLDSKVLGPGGILNDSIISTRLADRRMTDITVDQLLMHRAGFGHGGGDPMFTMNEIVRRNKLKGAPGSEQLASLILGRRRLAYEPGKSRRYSNFGYLLLSLVIEKITGKDYYEYVLEDILEPVGAANFRSGTNYYADRHYGEARYYGPDTALVEEYNGSGKMVSRVYGGNDIKGLKGAGGWVASAPDLLRIVAAIDGFGGVPDILGSESIALMTTDDEKENLTRGWAEIERDGSWIRTGTLSSSHAYIRLFPDGRCWVVLTNSGNWRGARFARDLSRLVGKLNVEYSPKIPRRNLW